MRLLSNPQLNPATESGWRRRWFDIIYRHDTPPSRNFDLVLIAAILASVVVIMLCDLLEAATTVVSHGRAACWLRNRRASRGRACCSAPPSSTWPRSGAAPQALALDAALRHRRTVEGLREHIAVRAGGRLLVALRPLLSLVELLDRGVDPPASRVVADPEEAGGLDAGGGGAGGDDGDTRLVQGGGELLEPGLVVDGDEGPLERDPVEHVRDHGHAKRPAARSHCEPWGAPGRSAPTPAPITPWTTSSCTGPGCDSSWPISTR